MSCSTARSTRSMSSSASGSIMSKTAKCSTFTAEVHVRYLRELARRHAGARELPAARLRRISACIISKQLHHAEQGWLSATSENMALNVDMTAKKVAAFPASVMARLERMKAAHDILPMPDGVGRRIAMHVKAGQ